MALATAWLETVFDESPRLSYRSQSRDTLGSSMLEEAYEETSPRAPGLEQRELFSPESGEEGKITENGDMETDGELAHSCTYVRVD